MKRLFFFIIVSLFSFEKSFSENNDIYKKIDLFSEVLEKINKEYVDEIDQSKSMDAAINGLLQSLDPYSAYMTPESFESMQTETSGKFGDIIQLPSEMHGPVVMKLASIVLAHAFSLCMHTNPVLLSHVCVPQVHE